MHDVLKPDATAMNPRSKRGILPIIGVVLLVALGVAALVFFRLAILTILIVAATTGAVLFALISIRRFKSSRATGGALFAVLALVCMLADVKFLQFFKMSATPMMMPATTVASAVVKAEDWAPVLSAVGSVSAVQGAIVSTELGGVVADVGFQNGGEAKKGDLLLKLDASAEEGQLHTAQADLELARANLLRTRDLAARKVVSKQELDAAESAFGQKQGAVDNMRSMIVKKEVHAPFDGQLGIRQVNVGQMINAGQQVVQLTALDPVFVDFALPQQELSKLAPGLETHVRTDAVPGREFNGKLTALNSMVDTVTRNVTLQATLDNPDHALKPGMFVKIGVVLPEKSKTLVIPGSAVSYAPVRGFGFRDREKEGPENWEGIADAASGLRPDRRSAG